MHIQVTIDGDSTAVELVALSHFANELALDRGAKVAVGPLVAPTDSAELEEPEVVVGQAPLVEGTAGTEAPKRRRRTKEEIAAANAATTPTEPAPEAGNAEPAVTQTANETTTEAVDPEPAAASPSEPVVEPEAFEVAAAASGKNYTEVEVQQIATVVARTHGADKVKAKIAELGAQRIAGLAQEKLNELGDYLDKLSKTAAA